MSCCGTQTQRYCKPCEGRLINLRWEFGDLRDVELEGPIWNSLYTVDALASFRGQAVVLSLVSTAVVLFVLTHSMTLTLMGSLIGGVGVLFVFAVIYLWEALFGASFGIATCLFAPCVVSFGVGLAARVLIDFKELESSLGLTQLRVAVRRTLPSGILVGGINVVAFSVLCISAIPVNRVIGELTAVGLAGVVCVLLLAGSILGVFGEELVHAE